MADYKCLPKYRPVYKRYSGYHAPDFLLKHIDEIYLPFWVCKQEIYVQNALKIDEFSKILLRLVEQGMKKRTEICSFLGVKEDDFCLSQIDYLLNHGFLEENHQGGGSVYEITDEGRNFLKDGRISDQDTIEPIEVKYSVSDLNFVAEKRYQSFYSDLKKEYFDKDAPPDEKFGGYKLVETHKLKKDKQYCPARHIPHEHVPTFSRIRDSNFIEFYNSTHDEVFYDFGKHRKPHKRSIKFYFLLFQNKADSTEQKIEIRRCKDSVLEFDAEQETLEETLSTETFKYIQRHSSFIDGLMQRIKHDA